MSQLHHRQRARSRVTFNQNHLYSGARSSSQRKKSGTLSVASRIWLGFFCLWAFILTGILSPFGGSPGLLQSLRLKGLLAERKKVLAQVESTVAALSEAQVRLERSRVVQLREIRQVLGYAASNELVFDFSSAERQ